MLHSPVTAIFIAMGFSETGPSSPWTSICFLESRRDRAGGGQLSFQIHKGEEEEGSERDCLEFGGLANWNGVQCRGLHSQAQ